MKTERVIAYWSLRWFSHQKDYTKLFLLLNNAIKLALNSSKVKVQALVFENLNNDEDNENTMTVELSITSIQFGKKDSFLIIIKNIN